MLMGFQPRWSNKCLTYIFCMLQWENGLKMIFLKTTIGYSIVFVMKHHIDNDMKIFKLELIEVFNVIHLKVQRLGKNAFKLSKCKWSCMMHDTLLYCADSSCGTVLLYVLFLYFLKKRP